MLALVKHKETELGSFSIGPFGFNVLAVCTQHGAPETITRFPMFCKKVARAFR